MELIDTHAHLDALEHNDLDSILANAARCEVNRYISIGASRGIDSARTAVALAESNPSIWASIGVHPHDAGQFTTLEDIEELATHPRVVAIGETGLDFFRDWAPKDRQFELFRNTISLAKKVNKPLIIHSRDAAEDVISCLQQGGADQVGAVFHCYAEDASFAKRLRDINCMVSFTGNLTFKKATALRDAAKEIPLEQIMLETDCPYMAPEPFRGKPSEPMYVYQIAIVLAQVKGITLEEVALQTTRNAETFFGLPEHP